jgi:hypothetical protein
MFMSHHQSAGQNYSKKLANSRPFESVAKLKYSGMTLKNKSCTQNGMALCNQAVLMKKFRTNKIWGIHSNFQNRIFDLLICYSETFSFTFLL